MNLWNEALSLFANVLARLVTFLCFLKQWSRSEITRVSAFERTCVKLQSTRSVKNRKPVLGPWYRALQDLNTFSTPEPFSFAHDRGRHAANNRRFWSREQIWTLFCQADVRQFVCARFSFGSKEYGGKSSWRVKTVMLICWSFRNFRQVRVLLRTYIISSLVYNHYCRTIMLKKNVEIWNLLGSSFGCFTPRTQPHFCVLFLENRNTTLLKTAACLTMGDCNSMYIILQNSLVSLRTIP